MVYSIECIRKSPFSHFERIAQNGNSQKYQNGFFFFCGHFFNIAGETHGGKKKQGAYQGNGDKYTVPFGETFHVTDIHQSQDTK